MKIGLGSRALSRQIGASEGNLTYLSEAEKDARKVGESSCDKVHTKIHTIEKALHKKKALFERTEKHGFDEKIWAATEHVLKTHATMLAKRTAVEDKLKGLHGAEKRVIRIN